jgi:hypothetical protein
MSGITTLLNARPLTFSTSLARSATAHSKRFPEGTGFQQIDDAEEFGGLTKNAG